MSLRGGIFRNGPDDHAGERRYGRQDRDFLPRVCRLARTAGGRPGGNVAAGAGIRAGFGMLTHAAIAGSPTVSDHRTRNDASRRRLRSIAERIVAGDPTLRAVDAWSPATALAHLAFWDRFVAARWAHARAHGLPIPATLPPDLGEMLNDAAAHAWSALPPAEVARLAMEAAEACDAAVADVTPEQLAALEAEGMSRLAERSHHRAKHFDPMEGIDAAH